MRFDRDRENQNQSNGRRLLRVVVIYALSGTLWILFSDALAEWIFRDAKTLSTVQTYKGFFYVMVTALAAFLVMRKDVKWGEIRDKLLSDSREKLAESEDRYRSLIDHAPIPILVHQDERYVFVNPAAVKALGAESESELVGRSIWDIVYPDFADQARKRVQLIYDGQAVTPRAELKWVRLDGRIMDVEVMGTNTVFNGRPASQVVFYDITDRKEAEAENIRLAVQLQRAERMESLGTLAGGVAHDFNNVLMGISGYASLLGADIDPLNPHFGYLQRIQQQVQSGADLTRQLLGFARGGKYNVRQANMNLLVDRTVDMFSRTRKQIVIEKGYQENLGGVEVDRSQIEQVILNILVNARQAMPGGGSIRVETRHVVLDEKVAKDLELPAGDYVRLSITDSGSGMDEETRTRVFEPFFTTKEMGRGTGLGMASAWGIIRNHGGTIAVRSEPKQGATFEVYLPISSPAVEEVQENPTAFQPSAGTALLVDDEEMILDVGSEMLKLLGMKVLAAQGGAEAVEVFRRHHREVSLVILDMIMPNMSGKETFARLKEIDPGVKVLLSTGYSLEGDAEELMAQGCAGFIQKPFTLNALSQSVAAIQNGATQSGEIQSSNPKAGIRSSTVRLRTERSGGAGP